MIVLAVVLTSKLAMVLAIVLASYHGLARLKLTSHSLIFSALVKNLLALSSSHIRLPQLLDMINM